MRRPVLQTVLALTLAAVFVAPVAAVEPGGAGRETLRGTLQGVVIESFHERHSDESYVLRTHTGDVPLAFEDGGSDDLDGATVEITGRRVGRTLHVGSTRQDVRVRAKAVEAEFQGVASVEATSAASDTTVSAASITTTAAVAKNIAVILINFRDNTAQPFTRTAVQTAAFTGTGSGKAFYEEESKGRMTISGTVFGWYTLATTSTSCDWTNWTTMGRNAVAAAGGNLSGYTNLIYVIPNTPACGWAGVAYVNGDTSMLNGNISVQVMTHEFGHNFGLGHASALACTVNGSRVALAAPSSCTSNAYADPFSTMGNNALRHNQGSQLGELGWLSSSEKVIGAPGNSYTIAPYFGGGAVKLVRVPRGDGTYFDLDFRTPYGTFDAFTAGSPAVVGVTIRLGVGTASPTSSPRDTNLIDTTPSTTDLKDAPLLVGKTLRDPLSGLSFTTVSSTSAGVVVQVKENVAPSAPGALNATATDSPSVDLSWTAATDNVRVASYRITRNGSTVATVAATATSWTDTGVAFGTSYTYTVAAIDSSGNVGAAASDGATTPPDPNPSASPTPTPTPDPSASPTPTPTPTPEATPNPDDQTAPTPPEPLSGTAGTTTVTLTWGPATDDYGVVAYRITRNGTAVATVDGASGSWKDGSRKPATTYSYTVSAVDTGFNVSSASALTIRTRADTTRPSTPRNFHVSARYAGGYVKFAWSPSTDNVRVLKYRIYREGRTKALAATSRTSIKIYTLKGYRYYVRAVDTSLNRSYASTHVRGR